ncbi:MAG: nucleotidyltransferase family protein [Alphaproteobacteria bacterium]|nr:nucleotidyltransferase family protein [Alphaproteobacteria bacterium]
MQAIILAGGFGTRLKSAIGEDVPKPMAPVGGEPFLAHYLRYLQGQGVSEALIALHHLAQTISGYFGDSFEGIRLRYAVEEKPLGTGGAVKRALAILQPEAPLFVGNGDSFVEIDIRAMRASHIRSGAALTIGLRGMPDCSRYGEVMFDAAHRITEFRYPGRAQPGMISTGCYIVSPDLFAGNAVPEAFSFEADFQRPFCAAVPMHAWLAQGYFIDIGVPEDYARAQAEYRTWRVTAPQRRAASGGAA